MARTDACTFYVVRVWSAGDRFRAEVRDVRCESEVGFTDAGELADFLVAAPRSTDAGSSPSAVERDRKE